MPTSKYLNGILANLLDSTHNSSHQQQTNMDTIIEFEIKLINFRLNMKTALNTQPIKTMSKN